jgi:SNF2 family DNA or RNA helicase
MTPLEKLAAISKAIQLQAHQEEAAKKSRAGGSGILLNWGLGSGKTIGALNISEQRGGNTLVVVPASLRENFRSQIQKAVTKDRHGTYNVISYDAFKKDPEGIVARIKPSTLIVDEIHRLRNIAPREPFDRVRSQIPYMIGLTGSLVNNRPEEVVPLVNLVAGKKVYNSEDEFVRAHIQQTKVFPGVVPWMRGVKSGIRESIKNKRGIANRLGPHIHRFTGDKEYLKSVPQVDETVETVELTDEQEKLYSMLENKNPALARKIRQNLPPSKRDLANMNSFMTAARQIANTPSAYVQSGSSASPKRDQIVRSIVSKLNKDENYKAIVYSNFLESGVSPVVDQLIRSKVPSAAFTGELNDAQRGALVERFNRGELKVLGLSPAGGEGLDLKGVKAVHLMEEHWNPERAAQAVGRGTRYKSHEHLPEEERNVHVTRHLAVHEPTFMNRVFGTRKKMSVDEWIDRRRKEKLELNRDLMSAIPKAAADMGVRPAPKTL